MDTKAIIIWVGLIATGIIIYVVSRIMKKQIEKNGIETIGVISHIVDSGSSDDISLHYYAKYKTKDGEEVEGLISNPRSDLEVGQQVRLKYHPKHKTNARLV